MNVIIEKKQGFLLPQKTFPTSKLCDMTVHGCSCDGDLHGALSLSIKPHDLTGSPPQTNI